MSALENLIRMIGNNTVHEIDAELHTARQALGTADHIRDLISRVTCGAIKPSASTQKISHFARQRQETLNFLSQRSISNRN